MPGMAFERPATHVESGTERALRLHIKTRRRRYLEEHPEYFLDSSMELADPLLYDRMVRQFQSTQERVLDGRRKGYSGQLEADLLRSEAKLEAIANPDANSPLTYLRDGNGAVMIVDQDVADRPKSKEEGLSRWREYLELRFLRGEDHEFDYALVDDDARYDDVSEMRQRGEDAYFDTQEQEFVGQTPAQGQTGEQDF